MEDSLKRCINLDWLEVYALEPVTQPRTISWYEQQGWNVEVRPYGTRSYKEMFTLLDQDGQPFIEVRRDPVGMFKDGTRQYCDMNGCHVRLVNRYCYADKAALLMEDFLNRSGLEFSRIAKVDLALDFERFDSGDYPARFLQRYMEGAYSKINQSNIAARGKDEWSGRSWNSVSWGAEKSPVLTRFYNKTKELLEVKDKPYIRQAWAECGLIDDPRDIMKVGKDGHLYVPQIWRVEFSVRSSVKRWITIDNSLNPGTKKQSFRNVLVCYRDREHILMMFASLALHFFHFKHFKEGVSKYKCKDKQLFNFQLSEYYKVDKVATAREKSDVLERLIKALQAFMMGRFEPKTQKACNILLHDLNELRLKDMAEHPWQESEVRLLRRLINRRLSCPDEPFAVSKKVAEAMEALQQTLWQDDMETDAVESGGTIVPPSDFQDGNT